MFYSVYFSLFSCVECWPVQSMDGLKVRRRFCLSDGIVTNVVADTLMKQKTIRTFTGLNIQIKPHLLKLMEATIQQLLIYLKTVSVSKSVQLRILPKLSNVSRHQV